MPRSYSIRKEQMISKLLTWNPHWVPANLEAMDVKQIYAIYRQEQQKTVKQIRASLGLA